MTHCDNNREKWERLSDLTFLNIINIPVYRPFALNYIDDEQFKEGRSILDPSDNGRFSVHEILPMKLGVTTNTVSNTKTT